MTAGGETIAAIATPSGRGGIGVVRVSGVGVRAIARSLLADLPAPRHARHGPFLAASGEAIDQGLALFFPAPHSYTGEDVLELQGHGGPVVMRLLLQRCVELGARVAEPGEFTRRAFLNERIDLAQAESVADLIDASSAEAARSAVRSLGGVFSKRIQALVDDLTTLRAHVEACIDFPEEEIDPSDREQQQRDLEALVTALDILLGEAAQGVLLRDGLTVVLVGRPNVGKSSLLNRLAGEDVAIVTPIAGTTRDYVRASVSLRGVPVHLIDTAGLREARDEVERIGVERAWQAVQDAGAILFIEAAGDGADQDADLTERLPRDVPQARITNKIDLSGEEPSRRGSGSEAHLRISAKTGAGLDALREWLLEVAGWKPHGEGLFIARERHLQALKGAAAHLETARREQAIEFKAEELRLAQGELARITGEVSADSLLGEIFSRFCIGK
ncbi:MAG: tRNA uridine-5-carboxymethylaminomethyl(34) synthesis GTPase MnmE [Usitatibacter sp.]